MKKSRFNIGYILLSLILIVAFAYTRMIWNDCRQDHGIFYCLHILSRE